MGPKKKRLRSLKSKKNLSKVMDEPASEEDMEKDDETEDEFFSKSEGEEEKQYED